MILKIFIILVALLGSTAVFSLYYSYFIIKYDRLASYWDDVFEKWEEISSSWYLVAEIDGKSFAVQVNVVNGIFLFSKINYKIKMYTKNSDEFVEKNRTLFMSLPSKENIQKIVDELTLLNSKKEFLNYNATLDREKSLMKDFD